MGAFSDLKKRIEVERWMAQKGEFYLTELVAKVNGWECECCGSYKDLDAYHLDDSTKTDERGFTVRDTTNENLICLCPSCYAKHHKNAVEALRHMTNPQIFKDATNDPRIKKYCDR